VRPALGAGLFLVTLLLTGGCAQTGEKPGGTVVSAASDRRPETFRLEGRISVRNGEENFSGGIRWAHDPTHDEILLSSPLGQGVAELRREAGRVSLTDSEGRVQEADSGEALLEGVLGVRLPLEGLVHWLLARPRPNVAHVLHRDAEGHVGRLEQDGWRLKYGRYHQQQAYWLPGRIFAQRSEELEFRLVVDTWETPR